MSTPRSWTWVIRREFLLIVSVPLLVAAWLADAIARKTLTEDMHRESERAAELVALRMQTHLSWSRQMARAAAASVEAVEGGPGANELLDAIVEVSSQLEAISLVSSEGVISAVGLPPDRRRNRSDFLGTHLHHEESFKYGSRAEPVWGNVESSILAGHSTLTVMVPHGDGRVAVAFDPVRFWDSLREVDQAMPGRLAALDRRGQFLYYTEGDHVVDGEVGLSVRELEAVPREGGVRVALRLGTTRLPGYAIRSRETGWLIVGLDDTSRLESATWWLRYTFGGVLGGAALVAIVAAWSLSRRLSRPVRALAAATEALTGGGPETALAVQPFAEFESLADGFRRMDAAVRSRELFLTELAGALAQGTGVEALERLNVAVCRLLAVEGSLICARLERDGELRSEALLVDGIHHPLSRELLTSPVWKLVDTGDGLTAFVRGDSLFPAESVLFEMSLNYLWASPILDAQGRSFGLVVALSRVPVELPPHGRDVLQLVAARAGAELSRMAAERALAEAELAEQEAQRQFLQAQKLDAIGTLVGGVAHDFNNLLAAILGFGELAELSYEEGVDPRPDIRELRRAGERARDIVAQLLSFSRPGAAERVPVELSALVREMLRLLRAAVPASVEFVDELATEELRIVGNATQLQQVLMNLCANAAQAMPEGGTITVRTRRARSGQAVAELEVEDTGAGMPPETLARALEPFFTTKEPGKGTGLGLSVVHGIVTAHEGVMEIDSLVGRGTRVLVRLPLLDLANLQPTVSSGSQALSVKGGRVVVVDDEEMLVQWAERALSKAGCNVVAFTRPEEALRYLADPACAVDMLLSDVTMPGMSGVELCREVRKRRPDLPIVLATGNSTVIGPGLAESLGLTAVLHKPFAKTELLSLIASTLGTPLVASSSVGGTPVSSAPESPRFV